MISIAMTTYNGEKYISQQLDSILNQTVSNFELIICDDCSSDNTINILNAYATKDSRIKIFINKSNLGFKKNFENAIKLCAGDYIALCDQDDVWEFNHLEVLINSIGDNLLISGNNEIVDNNLISLNIDFFSSNLFSLEKYPTNLDILKKIILSGNCFQGASMLLRKDILQYYLPLPENVQYHDSWLVVIATSLNKFTTTKKMITKYRQHDKQVTHINKNENNFIQNRILFCEQILESKFFINSEVSCFIEKSLNYFSKIKSILGRIYNLKFWKKNYKYLYPDMNRLKFNPRMIKYIFNL